MNVTSKFCSLQGYLRAACVARISTILLCLGSCAASGNDQPRRIYLVEGLTAAQPAGIRTVEAFRQRLKEKSTEHFELFIEYLDLGRFPGKEHEERTARYLSEKFSQNPPDLLVPISRGAIEYLVRYRAAIAPDAPMVYCCTVASFATAMNLPRNIPGAVTEYNWSRTLELAARLQPRATDVAIVSGASEYDRQWEADVRRELEPHLKRYNTRSLAGLSHAVLLKEVARLPRDTIVLMALVTMDGSGLPFLPPDVAADVAGASSAPVYAPIATFFGRGILGGYMDSFEAHGVAVADLALNIVSGKDPATLPHQIKPAHSYQIDARQLKRWKFAENKLPSDAIVSFRTPTLWEQHSTAVVVALTAFGLQTLVLAALLVQMRKRKEAEISLRESEDRMAFAAASTNVGLWQIETTSGDLWMTQYCRSMFNIAAGTTASLDVLAGAIHPDDRQAFVGSMTSALMRGLPIEGEYRALLAESGMNWFSVRGRPRFDKTGKLLRISGIFADITARKSAEAEANLQRKELAHLMRVSVLGELSGAIAHELNQPLTAILANAQAARRMIAGGNSDLGTITQILDDIVDEDSRAGQVIQRLRGLLKKGESQNELLLLNDLVESTLRLLHTEMISRHVKVDVNMACDLPQVSGDAVQLQQVLLNVLMNAMEAMNTTPPSRRQLIVHTRLTTDNYVEAVVSDSGCGIGPDDQARLFQPFVTTKEHGLGLGLSICSTIVNSHGGRLEIRNNADGGATVVFALPSKSVMEATL